MNTFQAWLDSLNAKSPRLWKTIVVTALLLAGLVWLASAQIGVVYNKTVLVCIALVIAYYADRAYFPDTRPHTFDVGSDARSRAELRRVILAAAILFAYATGA